MKNSKISLKNEAQEQTDLISWARDCIKNNIYPELIMLYAVPNGGTRDKLEAVNLKRQGVVAGVPDLCLAVPKGKYHGLYIEMKVHPNKTTNKQEQWLANLSYYGYAVKVCYGAVAAKTAIEHYLKLGE